MTALKGEDGMEPESSVDPSSACSEELSVVTRAVGSGTVMRLGRAVLVGGRDGVSSMGMSPRSETNFISRYLDTISAW